MSNPWNKFTASTGLQANPRKCKVYFGGVKEEDKQKILAVSGFEEGILSFKYLGVPLSSRKLSINQCQPLIDKIVARVNHWTTHLLSYAGRSQLVKSVLFSITAYWAQVFPLPKKILHRVEAICRVFLWSGKSEGSRKAPIAWDKICDPNSAGGLSIVSLLEWNKVSMLKLLWNIQDKKDKLWVKWLDAYYIKGKNVRHWIVPADSSWIVKQIMKSREWILDDQKWQQELTLEKFHTKKWYHALRGEKPKVEWRTILYHNHARPWAKFHTWMVLMGRIPTKNRIAKFGVITDMLCCFCNAEETIEHLYFTC
ncbi:uncharacterized protein LOC131659953 [Vicia villosa]|uniref:uncharacterized protein LOC131659953 n=1 Tax=Vicia villosa TaxID=3911 RepID=UPI00273BAC52|nr:uncharacterized protein LOC131659953 [Vicia villosa]